jgi:hypothetical protein
MIYQHEETGYVTETDSILNYPWFEIGGDMTKGNIYHDCFELTVQDIRFRIEEMEKEETENKDNHLTYQSLLKFFYDVRNIINT